MSPGDILTPAFDSVSIYLGDENGEDVEIPDESFILFLGEISRVYDSTLVRVLTSMGVGWIWSSNVRLVEM